MNTQDQKPVQGQDLVEGLAKGLRIIEAFDDEHPRLSASQAAARAAMTRSAARRHLLTLVHHGYAATNGKLFWLAPRVLRLGQSYLGAAALPRLAQPFIQRVSAECGETVNVSVLDGHEVVYLARSTPPRYVSIGYAVGTRVPAHVVTPGVVILATRTDTDLEAWMAEHDFVSFTGQTVTDAERFREQVREARALSFWTTAGQLDSAFSGISLALMDRRGVCHGALGMTVLTANYSAQAMAERLLPRLRDAAQALRNLL